MSLDTYKPFERELDDIKNNNNYRFLKTMQARDGKHVTYRDRRFINLSSNDYLGLASNAGMIREFYTGLNDTNCLSLFSPGSSSSRLLAGDHPCYTELEMEIAAVYRDSISENGPSTQREALAFTSGYHANTGIIPALAGKRDIILSDRFNHASIVDGVRLSRADCFVYGHLNYEELTCILDQKRGNYNKAFIVSESVFSMDGDIADIGRLTAIKKRFNAILYLDEAHAFGVFGDRGLGIADRDHAAGEIDIIVGTFGKAMGGLGAFAVTAPVVKEYLINKARPFIFTTALPPVVVNWNLFALRKLPAMKEQRAHLVCLSDLLRSSLAGMGLSTRGESQIVPAILGDNERTIRAAEKLQSSGFLVFPIRPPSVPHGSSRIRISLRADLDQEDIYLIPEILREYV
jgi:8-amino-7-oxononanoate synthase